MSQTPVRSGPPSTLCRLVAPQPRISLPGRPAPRSSPPVIFVAPSLPTTPSRLASADLVKATRGCARLREHGLLAGSDEGQELRFVGKGCRTVDQWSWSGKRHCSESMASPLILRLPWWTDTTHGVYSEAAFT